MLNYRFIILKILFLFSFANACQKLVKIYISHIVQLFLETKYFIQLKFIHLTKLICRYRFCSFNNLRSCIDFSAPVQISISANFWNLLLSRTVRIFPIGIIHKYSIYFIMMYFNPSISHKILFRIFSAAKWWQI